MFLLFGIAFVEGIGYSKSFHVISKTLVKPNHPCFGTTFTFNLTMKYNPFLYLVGYATGTSHSEGIYTLVYMPPLNNPHIIPASAEIEEKAVGNLVWSEVVRNLPYLFAVALALGIVAVKTADIVKNKIVWWHTEHQQLS